VPANQIIKVFDLKTGQSNQDNFLPFLQGMKAQDAKARLRLTLVKEDKLYTYIKIVPRLLEDKADFREARLVLWSQTLLPREAALRRANGNENIWDIPKIRTQPAPAQSHRFHGPQAAGGWKWEKAPVLQTPMPRNDVPPRVFRPESVARESRNHERRSLESRQFQRSFFSPVVLLGSLWLRRLREEFNLEAPFQRLGDSLQHR